VQERVETILQIGHGIAQVMDFVLLVAIAVAAIPAGGGAAIVIARSGTDVSD
jgi:hypothetical protein